jgi:hypothetical protein
MHAPWIGTRRIAVIPAIVNDPRYNPAPNNWLDQIQQRFYYDPHPTSGIDRSLRQYIHTISYGKALLEADIFEPVIVQPCDINAAIMANPNSHLYEFACIIFTGGAHGCGGWAFWDSLFPFNPARSPNNLRNWCRVNMDESLGVWAMEVLHMTTAFGDLYNTNPHPGNFDNMACSCGTHPSSYTKLKLGWLDPGNMPTAATGSATMWTLHALALIQPPPSGRVTAVRIPSTISSTAQRYFLVEARLRVDVYERRTAGISGGIPSEGVVVYEIDEATWPVQLRTPTALSLGQTYTNQAERLEITVTSAVTGGFVVEIRSTEHPDCVAIRQEIAEAEQEIRDLQEELQSAPTNRKAAIVRQIRAWQARLTNAKERGINRGCRL